MFLNTIKEMSIKPVANNQLKEEIPLKSGTRLSTFSISILYSIWRQLKESKGIQTEKEVQSIVISRWYDSIYKWSHQEIPIANKNFHWSSCIHEY